jgi:hypothetical protein
MSAGYQKGRPIELAAKDMMAKMMSVLADRVLTGGLTYKYKEGPSVTGNVNRDSGTDRSNGS